jgi:hypothetical protein
VTISPEELLKIVTQMLAAELADFTDRVLAVKARQTAATLDAMEESPLRAIYAAQLSPERQQRQHAPGQKLETEDILTSAERQELQTLTEQAERFNAVRIENVAQLAALCGKLLPAVMQQFGLWRTNDQSVASIVTHNWAIARIPSTLSTFSSAANGCYIVSKSGACLFWLQ